MSSQTDTDPERGVPVFAQILLKALLYMTLILLCFLFSPEVPQQFIYTEF